MSARKPRLVRSNPPRSQEADVRSDRPADLIDANGPRVVDVLDVATRAVARELGRQYAREIWKATERR